MSYCAVIAERDGFAYQSRNLHKGLTYSHSKHAKRLQRRKDKSFSVRGSPIFITYKPKKEFRRWSLTTFPQNPFNVVRTQSCPVPETDRLSEIISIVKIGTTREGQLFNEYDSFHTKETREGKCYKQFQALVRGERCVHKHQPYLNKEKYDSQSDDNEQNVKKLLSTLHTHLESSIKSSQRRTVRCKSPLYSNRYWTSSVINIEDKLRARDAMYTKHAFITKIIPNSSTRQGHGAKQNTGSASTQKQVMVRPTESQTILCVMQTNACPVRGDSINSLCHEESPPQLGTSSKDDEQDSSMFTGDHSDAQQSCGDDVVPLINSHPTSEAEVYTTSNKMSPQASDGEKSNMADTTSTQKFTSGDYVGENEPGEKSNMADTTSTQEVTSGDYVSENEPGEKSNMADTTSTQKVTSGDYVSGNEPLAALSDSLPSIQGDREETKSNITDCYSQHRDQENYHRAFMNAPSDVYSSEDTVFDPETYSYSTEPFEIQHISAEPSGTSVGRKTERLEIVVVNTDEPTPTEETTEHCENMTNPDEVLKEKGSKTTTHNDYDVSEEQSSETTNRNGFLEEQVVMHFNVEYDEQNPFYITNRSETSVFNEDPRTSADVPPDLGLDYDTDEDDSASLDSLAYFADESNADVTSQIAGVSFIPTSSFPDLPRPVGRPGCIVPSMDTRHNRWQRKSKKIKTTDLERMKTTSSIASESLQANTNVKYTVQGKELIATQKQWNLPIPNLDEASVSETTGDISEDNIKHINQNLSIPNLNKASVSETTGDISEDNIKHINQNLPIPNLNKASVSETTVDISEDNIKHINQNLPIPNLNKASVSERTGDISEDNIKHINQNELTSTMSTLHLNQLREFARYSSPKYSGNPAYCARPIHGTQSEMEMHGNPLSDKDRTSKMEKRRQGIIHLNKAPMIVDRMTSTSLHGPISDSYTHSKPINDSTDRYLPPLYERWSTQQNVCPVCYTCSHHISPEAWENSASTTHSGPICSFSYFPFQQVVHNWFIKSRSGMCCPADGTIDKDRPDPIRQARY